MDLAKGLATLVAACACGACGSPGDDGMSDAVNATPEFTSYQPPYATFGQIERLYPDLDRLIAPGAALELLAEGFAWTEGPVWVPDRDLLLFSDVPRNSIYQWRPGNGISLFMHPSGYDGSRTDIPQPGSNGLALAPDGSLLLAEHGNRRIAKLAAWAEPQGAKTTLADRYNGFRFNSPNDLVLAASGALYFTDPPYGLAQQVEDPERELPFQGIYLLRPSDGEVMLLAKQTRPNGIGLAPDGSTLYVANSDPAAPFIYAYDVMADGTLGTRRVFFDASWLIGIGRPGVPDGMEVDDDGNLWATGPGGVLIIDPDGRHLGTVLTGRATANATLGRDGSTLFVTAATVLAKLELN